MKDFIEDGESWFDEAGGFRIMEVTLSKLWSFVVKAKWPQTQATHQWTYVEENDAEQVLLDTNDGLQDTLRMMHEELYMSVMEIELVERIDG